GSSTTFFFTQPAFLSSAHEVRYTNSTPSGTSASTRSTLPSKGKYPTYQKPANRIAASTTTTATSRFHPRPRRGCPLDFIAVVAGAGRYDGVTPPTLPRAALPRLP